METWLIDMQPCNEGIVFLMAAYCADASSFIEFALGNWKNKNKIIIFFIIYYILYNN